MIKINRIFSENRRFVIFGVIGVVNTFIHGSSVIAFVEILSFNPVVANIIAFFTSNVLSYFMNAKWTFLVIPSMSNYLKFLIASTSSLILTVTLATLAEYMRWHYLIGLLLIIVISPLVTYFIYKLWVFQRSSQ